MKELGIAGFENLYSVNTSGQVFSLNFNHTGNKVELQGEITKFGYKRVTLYRNGTRRKIHVHRLVAEAFIPNPDNLPQINHIDENKLNNREENLEWCTFEYNYNFGTRIDRVSKANQKAVIQLSLTGEYITEFDSIKEATNSLNNPKAHQCNISQCCKGNTNYKYAYGFKWKYKEDYDLERRIY